MTAFVVLSGAAQAYPARPVRIIIAFAPGGPLEMVRPVAQKLTEALGQPFVVDYKPGGNSVIGADHVLSEAMQKILVMEDIRQAFNNGGVDPWYMKATEEQSWLEQEIDKWQKVTQAINYQPE